MLARSVIHAAHLSRLYFCRTGQNRTLMGVRIDGNRIADTGNRRAAAEADSAGSRQILSDCKAFGDFYIAV